MSDAGEGATGRTGGHDTFVERCVRGEAQPAAIDDAVDAWHAADTTLTLGAWLGMDAHELALWVREPSVLPLVVERHRNLADGERDRRLQRGIARIGLGDLVAGPLSEKDASEMVAAVLRLAGLSGLDACRVAAVGVSRCLSDVLGGAGSGIVEATVEARARVADGPGRVREVRLDWVPPAGLGG